MSEYKKTELQQKIKQKQAELKDLKDILYDLMCDITELQERECIRLLNLYNAQIGFLEKDVFEFSTKAQILKRKIQLIRRYTNCNEPVDIKKIDSEIKSDLTEYKEKLKALNEVCKPFKKASNSDDGSRTSPDDIRELKLCYRELSKKLHPDLNPNLTEKQKVLWQKVQEAYENQDIDTLKNISALVSTDEQIFSTEDGEDKLLKIYEDLEAECSEVAKNIELCKLEIETIKSEFPFNQKEFLSDNKKVEEKQEELIKSINEWKKYCKDLQEELESLSKEYHFENTDLRGQIDEFNLDKLNEEINKIQKEISKMADFNDDFFSSLDNTSFENIGDVYNYLKVLIPKVAEMSGLSQAQVFDEAEDSFEELSQRIKKEGKGSKDEVKIPQYMDILINFDNIRGADSEVELFKSIFDMVGIVLLYKAEPNMAFTPGEIEEYIKIQQEIIDYANPKLSYKLDIKDGNALFSFNAYELYQANLDPMDISQDKSNDKSDDKSDNLDSSDYGKNENSRADDSAEDNKQEEQEETLDELLEQLDNLVGLEQIKTDIHTMTNFIRISDARKNFGMKEQEMSHHLVFTGNPGTGKTTIARLIAKIYKAMGVLPSGQLVEADRSMLVGGYMGQTAIKTQGVIDEAMGGVLFVDEAYSLNSSAEDSYGKEAIETILKNMEDHRTELVVIVAGYDDLMHKFIESNPGLQSRFSKYFHFDDYTGEELFKVFKRFCDEGNYSLSQGATDLLLNEFQDMYNTRDKNFGNARTARNVFEHTLSEQANRLATDDDLTREELMELTEGDIKNAFRKVREMML